AAVSAPAPVATKQQPTMLYYVMLIALIVLSIFTLWLYQKSSNKALPELGVNQEVAQSVEPEQTLDEADVLLPFVETETVDVAEQESVVTESEPVVEEEPAPVEEELVIVEEEVATVVEEEPVVIDEEVAAVVEEEPVEIIKTDVVSEEEVLLDKPAYNVSQNDKMFVAPHDYETDTPVETVIETCADGNAPDADGCCAGENLMQLPDGSMACCSEGTGECFPPML
ncbi:MAG: hypothetical protein J6R99_01670, partial [Alphaproteobacteria bacterium]|nr:hypothetical protein [Alphaproteobacteria bacterium]